MHDILLKETNEECAKLSRDLKECILNHIVQAVIAVPGSFQEQGHVDSIIHLSHKVPAVGCFVEDIRDELTKHFDNSN